MEDDANKLPGLPTLQGKLTRKSTKISRIQEFAGSRNFLDPFRPNKATGKPTNPHWPHDIDTFTLNNNYIIFESKTKLW